MARTTSGSAMSRTIDAPVQIGSGVVLSWLRRHADSEGPTVERGWASR